MKLGGRHGLINLAMLFASKAGGALVVMFFMPLFFRLLGVEQFGVVAVILSLQAFLMMLDLGMSTMVGRDVAVYGSESIQSATTWRNAETILTVFYIGIAVVAALWVAVGSIAGLSMLTVIAIVGLFWALVLQNLGLSVLLSAKSFKAASAIQLVGALFRASLTVIAMKQFGATFSIFITAQLITSLLQLWVTRWACLYSLTPCLHELKKVEYELSGCVELLKRGKSLLLFGLAGAAVMQLDKPIIAAFFSANEVSTYFLAMTFCMTPIAVLAGPVFQYFQPHFISLAAQANQNDAQQLLSKFVYVLVLITVISSAVLWVYRDFWIALWLHNNSHISVVVSYVTILLPGVVIGAMGYIPYSLLTSQQDYHFQSMLSALMTVLTLALVIYFSNQKNVYAICLVYSTYHIVSTLLSWTRAIALLKTRTHALKSFVFAMKLLVTISIIAYLVKFLLSNIYVAEYQVIVFMLIMSIIALVCSVFYFKFDMQNKIHLSKLVE
jgi:O-antigen/teichoic acid export membrane protein